MYLPQFYSTPENSEWWGEGYTDWIAAKRAKKYNDSHYQPHIPLNENYYNLLEKRTMEWQTELMHKYGIDAMCFYHYYFKDGKKVLQKPAENLLEWKDIDMPFCFSWDSASWVRSWSAVSGNKWIIGNELADQSTLVDKDDSVLIEQKYGDKKDWEKHFYYLLPFFKDKRYVKFNEKPIFVIHDIQNIWCINEMIELWEQLAVINGLKGISMISTRIRCETSLYVISMEPTIKDGLRKLFIDYESTMEDIIRRAYHADNYTFLCGFPSFDCTPRKGEYGRVYTGSTPELFYKMMKYLYYIGDFRGNEFTFVNAWNEWGEGMHLEPDEKFGYQYLESLKKAQDDYKHLLDEEKRELFDIISGKRTNENDNENSEQSSISEYVLNSKQNDGVTRFMSICRTLDKWMLLKENNISLRTFFEDISREREDEIKIAGTKRKERKTIKASICVSIAIYGIGMLGRHLLTELNQEGIEVAYGIDIRDAVAKNINIYKLEDIKEHVDIVIVTVMWDYTEIYKKIKKSGIANEIISLEQMINSVSEKQL